MKFDYLKTINELNFSSNFSQAVIFYKRLDHENFDDELNKKVILGQKIIEKEEVAKVWGIYNLSSSIFFRMLCLITLAEYYFSVRRIKEFKSVKNFFLYLLESNESIFYKNSFLVDAEIMLIKRLNHIFSKEEKFFIFNLSVFKFFKCKSIISFIKGGVFDNLDNERRVELFQYFYKNINMFDLDFMPFNQVLSFFKDKQNNKELGTLLDKIYDILIGKREVGNVFVFQQNLENYLNWVSYSSNKEEKKNDILIRIKNNSKKCIDGFNTSPYRYSLSNSEVEEILAEFKPSDSNYQIMLDISSKMINCYSYEENPQAEYLHEHFTMTYLNHESVKMSSLGSQARDLNIKRGKQRLEIYNFFIVGVYMPYLKKRKDFDYVLQQLKNFDDERDRLINEVVMVYMNNKNFLFISAVLPLIESKLRNLLKDAGESDIQSNDKGGFDYRVIGAFFRSKRIERYLSKSELFMMSLILDKRSGYNLRNKLAHGLMEPYEFNRYYSDILMLILVFLSSLDFKES